MKNFKKQLTTDHTLLINRIRKCIIVDELNHTYRLQYSRPWIDKFLDLMESRGEYSDEEGKILMSIRDKFYQDLTTLYSNV